MEKVEFYIEYLNAKDRFRRTRKEFTEYSEAVEWGKKNLENFNIDMIKSV